MKKLFRAVGSSKKAEQMEDALKSKFCISLAIKSKLAMTDTDYRTDTREETHGDC
jgi:hypothetical protein